MSVKKVKSDLNSLCNIITPAVTSCDRLITVVNSLGFVSENDLSNISQSANRCISSIKKFESIVKTVHSECSIELNIFFKEYNTFTQNVSTECTQILEHLENLIDICNSCREFYQISNEVEWILMCNVTPDLFTWIAGLLYSFKNKLNTLQLKSYERNSSLIMKVRK